MFNKHLWNERVLKFFNVSLPSLLLGAFLPVETCAVSGLKPAKCELGVGERDTQELALLRKETVKRSV